MPEATTRGYNLIQLESYTNSISTYNNGSWTKQNMGTVPRGRWEHLVCVKQGTSIIITTLNQTKTVNWNSISDSVLTTGLDGWQDTVHMKNIKIKQL